jgi:hypothetical protein
MTFRASAAATAEMKDTATRQAKILGNADERRSNADGRRSIRECCK